MKSSTGAQEVVTVMVTDGDRDRPFSVSLLQKATPDHPSQKLSPTSLIPEDSIAGILLGDISKVCLDS